jgi:hypothetical protein
MRVKMVNCDIPEKALKMLNIISKLSLENKDINPHSISKECGTSWEYTKKTIQNNFNIKEKIK